MPFYRMYRLNAVDKIIDASDFEGVDVDAAKAEAIRIEHPNVIEIWCEKKMVARVGHGT